MSFLDNLRIKLRLIGLFLKYGGFAVFGVALGLVILFSVMQWQGVEWLATNGIFAGVGMIVIGIIIEKVV